MSDTDNAHLTRRIHHVADGLFGSMDRERTLKALTIALLVACAVYRVELGTALYGGSALPLGFDPRQVPIWVFLKGVGSDLLVTFSLMLAWLGAKVWLRWRAPRLAESALMKTAELIVACLFLLGFVLVMRGHHQLLLELGSGLTVMLLMTASSLFSANDFAHMFKPQDVVFVGTPIIVFGLAWIFCRQWRRVWRPIILSLF